MRQAAALRYDGGGGRGASRDGVAHRAEQRGLDGVASERDRGERVEGGDETTGLGDLRRARPETAPPTMQAARPRWRGRERDGSEGEGRGGDEATGLGDLRGARPETAPPTVQAARPRWRGRERWTTTTAEVTTTTRTRWWRWARKNERKDVAETGKNSCR
jgi:hypothetical protein